MVDLDTGVSSGSNIGTPVAAAAAAEQASPRSCANDSGRGGRTSSSSSNLTNAASSSDGSVSGAAAAAGVGEAAKPGKKQIKLKLLLPSGVGKRKEKSSDDRDPPAHPAGRQEAGKGVDEAVDEAASQQVDSDASSAAAVMARGGKEAAMARLTGARGAVKIGVNDGGGESGGPAPMDMSVPTVSCPAGGVVGNGEGEEGVVGGATGAGGSGGSVPGAGKAEDAEPDAFGLSAGAGDGAGNSG